ncbi:MAG: accessory factor UbiK family protein [Alphaproteobacteria bacterium]|nr:accessory factor UbiK family protein [Alphaproteobacteria bacterium]
MPKNNAPLLEELLTLGEHALSRLMNSRHAWHEHARAALNDVAQKCDLVTRDEFDAAMAMLSKARTIQEELKERLAILESKMNQSGITMNRAKPRKAVFKKMKTGKSNLRSVKQGNRRKRR